ncbi:MAG: PEP-CTERM sorting domain-containing protein [Phycisphaerales bacterium]|nr:PEP-CTERM sorting domain-containing protein [Phycisphaerales bacterium]
MMRKVVFAFALMGIISSAAFAKPAIVDPHLSVGTGGPAAAGPGIYSTGFEAAAGFVPGALPTGVAPEGAWTTNGAPNDASISTLNPNGGAQHLRQSGDALFAQGTGLLSFSPVFSTVFGASSISMDINISNTGGADYDLFVQAPGAGNASVAARVKFFFGDNDADLIPGDIVVLGSDGIGGLAFNDTGADYTPGVYHNLRLEIDPNAGPNGTINYFLDNVLIHTDVVVNAVVGDVAPGAVDQIALLNDNFQLLGETVDYDNISVTPEPATLALLGFGAIAMIRRRR